MDHSTSPTARADRKPLYIHREIQNARDLEFEERFIRETFCRMHQQICDPLEEPVAGPGKVDPFYRCHQAITFMKARNIDMASWAHLQGIEDGPFRLEAMAHMRLRDSVDRSWPAEWSVEGGFESWFVHTASHWLNHLPSGLNIEAKERARAAGKV